MSAQTLLSFSDLSSFFPGAAFVVLLEIPAGYVTASLYCSCDSLYWRTLAGQEFSGLTRHWFLRHFVQLSLGFDTSTSTCIDDYRCRARSEHLKKKRNAYILSLKVSSWATSSRPFKRLRFRWEDNVFRDIPDRRATCQDKAAAFVMQR